VSLSLPFAKLFHNCAPRRSAQVSGMVKVRAVEQGVGNTMYLNRPEVLKVLTDLRNNVAKFFISFDYLTEAVINYATGDERISAFVKRFAEMGAPWTFGIDDPDALAGDAGLTVVDDVKTAELFRTFWPKRQLDSKWYDNYALCTLAAP
jgi:O-methyltransferase involved in polyketide biosynthesis